MEKGDLVRYVTRVAGLAEIRGRDAGEIGLIVEVDDIFAAQCFYYVKVLLSDGSTTLWHSNEWEIISSSSCKPAVNMV